MPQINYDDFTKIEMRVGVIVDAENFPEAKVPAYKLTIDFGEYGLKKSSAQITDLYSIDDLLNRQVIAVTNFPPKRIAGFKSEVLVLGASDDKKRVVLLEPERHLPIGSRIF